MRVFLDANILFSASDPKSATRELFNRVQKRADLITNVHAKEEARRNLELKRTHLLSEFTNVIESVAISNTFCSSIEVALPEQDVPIMAGAISSRCTHLWTSDKRHFGKLYGKEILGVLVVNSIMMLDQIKK